MSHDSTVGGVLQTFGNTEENQKVIDQLPASHLEDDFPCLTSNMFSLTTTPQYRDCIFHFAASYKDICDSWTEFEHKLERLLIQMDWYALNMHVEDCYMGDFIVKWKRNGSSDPAQWDKQQYWVDKKVCPPGWLGKLAK